MKRIGVLALQGDVVEHLHALQRAGVEPVEVKNERRLVVSVSLLQRAVAVEIHDVMVEPLSNRPISISDAA